MNAETRYNPGLAATTYTRPVIAPKLRAALLVWADDPAGHLSFL